MNAVFIALATFLPQRVHSKRDPVTNAECWSKWSPCTVTCIPEGGDQVNFGKRWRIWLPERCPNVKEPKQNAEFKNCSKHIPPCLHLETFPELSSRTIYRLAVLATLIIFPVIPSMFVCYKYSSGLPMIRWERGEDRDSPRTSAMEEVLRSDHMQSIQESLASTSEVGAKRKSILLTSET
ncbi:hypothetical protein Q1695_004205 [Nippostrongylus brasiliensis]|nr:hypothetical protein Q1695_004205 [Nippostrongylus brasiliensis]